MIGKRIALEVVPNQALFCLSAAAQYLGISPKALREDTDAGRIRCYAFHGRRTYKLEELEKLRASLPEWDTTARQVPASAAS